MSALRRAAVTKAGVHGSAAEGKAALAHLGVLPGRLVEQRLGLPGFVCNVRQFFD